MRAVFQTLGHELAVGRFVRMRAAHVAAVLRWVLVLAPMAIAVGSLCALFLWSLDRATALRFDYPWLLYCLPVAGLLIGLLYHWKGKAAEGGNNLIVDQIHEPGGGVPLRMAPLILVATVLTHLFGGSAGREGTAVQLGGSLASAFGRLFALDEGDVRVMLMAGIAAGFGAVFGTPIAGAVFALEVLSVGRIQYSALVPCLGAAILGDWTCHAWGIHHAAYHIDYLSGLAKIDVDPVLLLKVAAAGVAFGLAGLLFAEANHGLSNIIKKLVPYAPLRPFLGGIALIGLVWLCGTREYLGLGVWSPNPGDVTIAGFFGPTVHPWSWALKILFTVVTLSFGFKGGEVTPLFFIGAALGNALGSLVGAPIDLFAALGFIAVFAGAANTPLACTLMGMELFGATHGIYMATACFVAYLCSGHSGIYLAQRIAIPKTGDGLLPPDATLRDARQSRPQPLFTLVERLSRSPSTRPSDTKANDSMPFTHAVHSSEIGMIRIYMKPGERVKQSRLKSFWSAKPLYRELVQAAKADGIMNAVAHHTHYGFSNHGPVQQDGSEISNPELTMCVELIDPRDQLELFCRRHGELLARKVIVYKHLEHWSIGVRGIVGNDGAADDMAANVA